MNIKTILIPFFLCMALVACTTTVDKRWEASGGNRSDGKITLSYSYERNYEIPVLSDEQALVEATHRCEAWGYDGAEAFSGQQPKCSTRSGIATCAKDYQCVYRKTPAKITPAPAPAPMQPSETPK